MSKYIIEIPDNTRRILINVFGEWFCSSLAKSVDDLEELNSDYINEHYGQLQDEAYQRGLEDAWETARKLFSSMADSDIEKAFPIEWNNGGFKALMNLQPQEAIEKLKAYEDTHSDRIEVGDEVISNFGIRYVVTYCSPLGAMCGVSQNGTWCNNPYDKVTKTGKHYDIQSILEAMQK